MNVGGVLLLFYSGGCHSVAGYQQHSLRNIAVPQRCFSLSTNNFTKFHIPLQVLFTFLNGNGPRYYKESYLKHRFLRFFVYFFFHFRKRALYYIFSIDRWYDSKHSVNQKNEAVQMCHYGRCHNNTFSAGNYMFKVHNKHQNKEAERTSMTFLMFLLLSLHR